MIVSFADIEIDTHRHELRRSGELISIEPLIFDLIVFLANHAHELLNRDQLITCVWQGRIVSDSTVSSAIKSARRALGDDGTQQRFIKTVHGRGFKFIGIIQTTEMSSETSAIRNKIKITQTKQPSVIVLGFKTLSDDSDTKQISAGLQANIESILTRVPLLNISAQSSEFSIKTSTATAKQIHEKLRIDYVIDGIIQIIENRYIVNINLTQAKSGFRLWSQQFEQDSKNNKSVLDTLVITIISKLEPQLNRAIYNSIDIDNPPSNSRLLYLQASTLLATKGWHRDSFLEAADLLRLSGKKDPLFALAPAYLSLILALGHRVGLLAKTNEIKHQAIAAADIALKLDNMDSTVLGFSGCALADVGLLTRAFNILKNAVELDHANAQAWTALGSAYLLNKQTQLAIQHLNHGIEISPLDSRLSIWLAVLALAYIRVNNLDQALINAQLACQRDDRTYFPKIVLASIYLINNNKDEAVTTIKDAYRIKPDLSEQEIQGVVGKKLMQLIMQLKITAE